MKDHLDKAGSSGVAERPKKEKKPRTADEASLMQKQASARREYVGYQEIKAAEKVVNLGSWQKECHAFLSGMLEKDFVARRLAQKPVELSFTQNDDETVRELAKKSIAKIVRCFALRNEKGIEVVYRADTTVADFRKLATMLSSQLASS